MAKIEKRDVWRAEVTLELSRIAFAAQYEERGKGSERKRYIIPTNWLADDGKTLLFDVGKRLKGWIKEVVLTTKPSLAKKIQYGLFAKSLPKPGLNPLQLVENGKYATLDDIAPSKTWKNFQYKDLYELGSFPEPEVEHLISGTTGTSIFRQFYVLEKNVIAKANIFCLAQISPNVIESWLREIGEYKGLGDCHSAPECYGTFTVRDFHTIEEKKIVF